MVSKEAGVRGADTVRSLMRPCDEVIHPDHELREAAERLLRLEETFLPVCDGDELIGVLSARDLRRQGISSEEGYVTVRAAMETEFSYCLEDDRIETARRVIESTSDRKICVVNDRRELVGLLTLDDIVRYQRKATKGLARERNAARSERSNESTRRVGTKAAAKQAKTNGPRSYSTKPKIRK